MADQSLTERPRMLSRRCASNMPRVISHSTDATEPKPKGLTYDKGFCTATSRPDSHPRTNAYPIPRRMLTTAQVADQLQLSIAMVRKAIRDGRLVASLPAGRKHGYRIAPSAVERWLTESRVAAADE